MEEWIKTAVSQAPGLVVLCFLVRLFLQRDKERDLFIKNLHEEHIDARREAQKCIAENTESNRSVTRAIVEFEGIIAKCQK